MSRKASKKGEDLTLEEIAVVCFSLLTRAVIRNQCHQIFQQVSRRDGRAKEWLHHRYAMPLGSNYDASEMGG